LFGYRSVSAFAVELANRFLDDPRFDFVDHVLTILRLQTRMSSSTACSRAAIRTFGKSGMPGMLVA
jgi:hypothetical protein